MSVIAIRHYRRVHTAATSVVAPQYRSGAGMPRVEIAIMRSGIHYAVSDHR